MFFARIYPFHTAPKRHDWVHKLCLNGKCNGSVFIFLVLVYTCILNMFDIKYNIIFNKYKTFSVLIYSYINTSGIGKTRNFEFSQFHECWYNYISIRKKCFIFFYNIAMSKARRIRKISVFTSGGKFHVLTLSYINTVLSQSAFRIYKCYTIKLIKF
jgi:hypothetical protein